MLKDFVNKISHCPYRWFRLRATAAERSKILQSILVSKVSERKPVPDNYEIFRSICRHLPEILVKLRKPNCIILCILMVNFRILTELTAKRILNSFNTQLSINGRCPDMLIISNTCAIMVMVMVMVMAQASLLRRDGMNQMKDINQEIVKNKETVLLLARVRYLVMANTGQAQDTCLAVSKMGLDHVSPLAMDNTDLAQVSLLALDNTGLAQESLLDLISIELA